MGDGRLGSSRYEVLTRIATGGMATVYVGRLRGAVGFSRLVAVKKPHPFVTADAGLRKELEHEARIASMIQHPNVVSVLDVEEIDGELALVMDYIEGCTLRDLLDHAEAEGRPIDRLVVRIVLDAAAGLHAAHRLQDASGATLGLVHRDVSPHNVLIGRDGVARLTDFGIAKVADAERERTATDVLKGKLAYLAPEYVEERRFEARSDLFALGVVTWESFALTRLFRGGTTTETLRRVLAAQAPLLSTVRAELAPLDEIVASALRRTPEERPPSVEVFASNLEARARELDLVASHAEVGELVERVAGAACAARRRAIESASTEDLQALEAPRRSARDDVATVSLAVSDTTGPRAAVAARAPRRARTSRGLYALLAGAPLLVAATAALAWSVTRTRADQVQAEGARLGTEATSLGGGSAPPASVSAAPGAAATDDTTHAARAPDAGALEAATTSRMRTKRRPPTRSAPHATQTAPLVPSHAPPNPYSK